MFRRFRKSSQIQCPLLLITDSHTTSPGEDEYTVARNDLKSAEAETVRSEIYDRAREIYYRAKKSGRRRSAGII